MKQENLKSVKISRRTYELAREAAKAIGGRLDRYTLDDIVSFGIAELMRDAGKDPNDLGEEGKIHRKIIMLRGMTGLKENTITNEALLVGLAELERRIAAAGQN